MIDSSSVDAVTLSSVRFLNREDLKSLPSLSLSDVNQLPEVIAVYFVRDSNGIFLYIGQTTNLLNRWRQHHRMSQLRTIGNARISWLTINDVSLLTKIEKEMIGRFKPLLNNIPYRQKHSTKIEVKQEPALEFTVLQLKSLIEDKTFALETTAKKLQESEVKFLTLETKLFIVESHLARVEGRLKWLEQQFEWLKDSVDWLKKHLFSSWDKEHRTFKKLREYSVRLRDHCLRISHLEQKIREIETTPHSSHSRKTTRS